MKLRQHTNLGRVIGGTEDEFRGAVVSRTDVGDVRFVLHQNLGTTEIAKLEYAAVWVKEQVLRLDVTMAYALRMDVCQGSEELVDVELDLKNRHGSFHLVEETGCSVYRLGHEFLHQVQVNFVLLNPQLVFILLDSDRMF